MSLRRTFVLGAVLAGPGWLAGCGDSTTDPVPPPPPPPDPPRATTVAVSPAAAELAALGATVQLAAEVRDQNGQVMAGAAVTWTSGSPGVATVSASGLVTAVGNGTATITATAGSAAGSSTVTVAQADRAVLVALYEATNGAGWLENGGWLSDRPIGEWHGVTTAADGRVTALRLSASNLVGSIPPELGRLVRLETLDLERNRLAGRIPPALGRLASLESLNLGVNQLRGGIPPELGALGRLEVLRLRRNDLTGPIPPELSNLRNLRRLGLERNRLAGSIPAGFLELERFQTLHFESNDGLCVSGSADFRAWLAGLEVYVGPLCDARDRAVLASLYEAGGGTDWIRSDGWLGDGPLGDWHGIDSDSLGRVVRVDLADNGMTGRVPARLGQLSSLTSLRIGGNPGLEGPLPLSLSALSLRELHYADTGLCISPARSFGAWLGAIPSHEGTGTACSALDDREILALLYEATGGPRWADHANWLSDRPLNEWAGVTLDADGRVVGLSLASNNLTGLVPPELGGLSNLARLDLRANSLTGRIPAELGNLSGLTTLELRSNDLTGRIPPALGGLSYLVVLDLAFNDLTGPIPPGLGNLSRLTTLNLGSNGLTASIPPELGGLSRLTVLNLRFSGLRGPIPPELSRLSRLTVLDLSYNGLTGSIPPELGSLPALTALALGSNDLTGPIPPSLGGLSGLTSLFLNGNNLTGPIPAELGGLSNLARLYLYHNDLTGPIPPELGRLPNVTELYLYNNDLAGPIPAELGALSRLRVLSVIGNRLTGPLPEELGDLASLRQLHLTNNPGLSGPLPERLTALTGLQELLLNGTDLCANADAGFQAWLSGVQLAQVRACKAARGSGAYLTQAIQSSAFPVPLVAGDEALLRVFVTASRSTSEGLPPMRATFYLDGVETYVADIPGSGTPIPTDVEDAERALDKSANIEIPGSVIQPGLEFVVEVDPANTLDPGLGVAPRIPETGRASVRVEAVPALDLTVVPFVWAAGSDLSIVDIAEGMAQDPQGHEMLWHTRTLLPVRDLDVKAHEPILTSTTNVVTLYLETALAWTLEGRRGRYMGIMPAYVIGGQSGIAAIGGFYSFSVADPFVISHEIGHNLSLRHAPCGGAGGPDPAFPQPDGTVGNRGYDFRGSGALVSPRAADIMSYCGPPHWISGYGFTKALNYRLQTETDASASRVAAVRGPVPAQAPTTTLLLWGGADARGEPFLEPAFVLDAPPSVPPSDGEYELTGRAETGDELFSLSFDMQATVDGDGGSAFVIALPAPAEWVGRLASITLSGPAGSTTLDRATDRPMAILRDPESGRLLGILRGPSSGDPVRTAASAGLAAAGAAGSELEVLVSRGIPAAPPR
ncbi:Ig-like domain-containing protein [Candidatus Palauibacter polyketidifaciens]|uniref:Ig-like domain-containing protein n=1 Tax=Candidatus Palauibacter polyketidifaciens TaxID=3056740 RepID=UPI0023A4F488|nr:Ig-like domain-containing protein [Candidatus Palauibacter polyketidifaciens]MDE2719790.1 Ig-like domain-containing protein [Candidatus Palauibacter polyketidifaciens]